MAAASLGRLTLDLAVKLGSFEQGMTQAERKTKDTTEKMGKAFGGFKSQVADALGGTQIGSIVDSFNTKIGSLKGGVLVAGAALTGMAVGGIAVATGALAKMAIDTAKADAQLLVLANRANTSAENFQILQYAASGLGVTQDQLGSILADVQEKLGEFSATAGGGAADFFDALKNNTKMTEDQIKSFGKTLQGKDGIEAIQILNDKMDELGVTSQERRFIFESLASDLAHLAPIFAENGDLLEKYGDALRDAGVIKSGEALEQSKLLAAQTESVRMRFDGLKSQLATQMMPALNSLVSHFIDGATKGGQFGGIIKSVGVIARGVGVVIIGVAASIEVMIKVIAGLIDQAKNVAKTALDVWNADGVVAKAKATWNGLANAGTLAVGTFVGGASAIQTAMDGAGSILDSATAKTDKLTEANLAIAEAAKKSAAGLRTNTKEADENAKAKEKAAAASAKAAKEQENLNKMVGASALSGLRIKSSEAFAGGQVRGYTANFAQMAQKQLGSSLNRFTAFNDLYHKGTNSKHATGNAFDLTLTDPSKSAQAAKNLEAMARQYGYIVKVIDEYRNPSKRSTGGHLHVSVLGFKGTAEAAKMAQEELGLIASTNAEAQRLHDERVRAQQTVIGRYYSDLEKLQHENNEAIKAIDLAFANDDTARQKYLQLQEQAYQKDLAEYQEAQDKKRLEERKILLETKHHWMTAGEYARQYYALVRQEILNTPSYSPEMKQAMVKDANFNQGLEENSEREQIWGDYQSRFGEQDSPYENDLKLLQAARKEGLVIEEEYQQQRLALQIAYGAQYGGEFAGMLMGLVDQSSSAYAILGGIQKGFTLYSVAMSSIDAIGKAWNSAPFPYNLPAVGMVTVETGLLQAAVSALSPTIGMAHDGIDNIPKEGTWLLDKGERVVDSRTNADLKGYLQDARSQTSSPNITINVPPGYTAQQSQSNDGITIDIVDRLTAQNLANPNSETNKAYRRQYATSWR